VNQVSTFYFSASIISRGKNQSAVASASYRSGESLYSELDMETKSYGKRTVQPDTFILAPSHAPEWVYNRERLWNEVEYHESKINSQLSREVKLALPVELNHDTQRQMLEEYVQENFVDRGMVADVSIHRDVEHNPHAHIMLTVRPFNENGEWGSKQKREYRLDENGEFILNKNGKKKPFKVELTDWDKKETLLEWRKNLAEKINQYYVEHGIKESVSHESYEQQGLDKIPKHRLEKTEFQIEKRERENAEKEGREYKPRTTFAQLNYEIEKTNAEIEMINQKVIDLNEYRESVKGSFIDELKSIRDNNNLSPEDWKAIKGVAKRVDGFVDIHNAKDNLNRLDFWKRKLDSEKSLIIATGKTLEKAKRVYNEEPKKVMMYGFVPNKFEESYRQKVSHYENQISKYNETIKAYNDLYKYSQRAYAIQKDFINEEFKYLYPDYADKIGNNDKAMELKSQYVEMFKKEGILRHEMPELNSTLNMFTDKHDKLNTLLEDWKQTNNSLMILERTKEKHKREYAEQYKDWDSKNVYEKSLQYTNSREQITNKELHKQSLEQELTKQMVDNYPEISQETIVQIPYELKAKILELHLSGNNTGELSKDLKLIEKESEKDLSKQEQKFNNETVGGDLASGTGDLFSGLINSAQQDEDKSGDLERKRQRDKKQKRIKLRQDIGEMEL
jgi:hypothetical protein